MKKYIYVVFLMIFFSCKKEYSQEKSSINSQVFFSEITNVSKLRDTIRIKLNDSTYKIKGALDSLQITGYLTKDNEKINWWEIVNINKGKVIATVEYRLINNKVFANQYRIFENSELNGYRSKYYNFFIDRSQVDKTISYFFHLPKSDDIIKSKGTFLYSVHDIYDKNKKNSSKCECISFNNLFECTFPIPNRDTILISGVFWELSQTKDGQMAGSEIYVRDTINSE